MRERERRERERERERQTDRDRQRDRERQRQRQRPQRQRQRQTDRQTERQTDRTDRQTDRTERERATVSHCILYYIPSYHFSLTSSETQNPHHAPKPRRHSPLPSSDPLDSRSDLDPDLHPHGHAHRARDDQRPRPIQHHRGDRVAWQLDEGDLPSADRVTGLLSRKLRGA